jgi:hypothetical protein
MYLSHVPHTVDQGRDTFGVINSVRYSEYYVILHETVTITRLYININRKVVHNI